MKFYLFNQDMACFIVFFVKKIVFGFNACRIRSCVRPWWILFLPFSVFLFCFLLRIIVSLVFSLLVDAPSFPCFPSFHLIYMGCFHVCSPCGASLFSFWRSLSRCVRLSCSCPSVSLWLFPPLPSSFRCFPSPILRSFPLLRFPLRKKFPLKSCMISSVKYMFYSIFLACLWKFS